MLARIRRANKKENIIIAYKLLADALFIMLAAFILAMLAEGALPGIITSHIGLSKIAMLIMLDVLIISSVIRIAEIPEKRIANKKIAQLLFIVMGLLIFNSLLQLNIFLAIFLSVAIFTAVYFLLKVFQEKES